MTTLGPCAKQQVFCTLTFPDGYEYTGENYCNNAQETCPRMPGEDYTKCRTICHQSGHAEIVALSECPRKAAGATARVTGHTYACRSCQEALFAAGVVGVSADIIRAVWTTETMAGGIIVRQSSIPGDWLVCRCVPASGSWALASLDDGLMVGARATMEEFCAYLNEGGFELASKLDNALLTARQIHVNEGLRNCAD